MRISSRRELVATVAVLALVFLVKSAAAGEHPVPLEKNTDAAKCLECHEEKSKGKHVHSAIAMGCTACHEIKTEGETTQINLNQPANQLCFTCHANEAKEEDSKHGPWEKGNCIFCHDPHQSDFDKQLRAEGNALCLECHDASKGPMPEKLKLFGSHEINRDQLEGLHRLRLNADGTRGHPLGNHWISTIPDPTRPGEKMSCLTCHVPHSSQEDKLARVITGKDQAGKEIKTDACSACHDAMDKQAVADRARRVPELEKQIQQSQAEAEKKRQEYQKKLPKLSGDDRDQQ